MNERPARERTRFGEFMREVGDELIADRRDRVPGIAPPAAPWRRLSTPTRAIPGESLRGLVARACANNDLPNSWGLLQHMGQRHRNRVIVSEDPGVDPAELAYALGAEESEVWSRRYEPLAAGRVSFFGLEINQRRIETRVRRFSPTMLRQAEGRCHRAIWELRDLPFCLESWDMLQDRCGCETNGLIQGWTRTLTQIDECDECGDPLGWLEPFDVPIDMRSALEVLKAIVDPLPTRRQDARGLLPESLRHADRGRMFKLVVRIAEAADPGAATYPIEDSRARLNGLHRACQTLLDWPLGLDWLSECSTAKPAALAAIRSAWRQLETDNLPTPPKTLTPGRRAAVPNQACVGIRRATEIAKLSAEILSAAWEHGLVARLHRAHGDRTLPAFDPAELPAFGAEWRERVGPQSLAHQLGISYHGVEQMVAMDVVQPDAKSLPGTGPHFTLANVRSFLSKLTHPTAGLLRDAVPLVDVVRLIGGRPKPWGPIMKALLQGNLPFSLRESDRPIDSIMIDGPSASVVHAMSFNRNEHEGFLFADRMIRRDALEMLNFSSAGTKVLDALSWIGNNPKTYSIEEVERLAAAVVGLPELAARLGTDPATTHQKLKRLRIEPIVPGGWDRSALTHVLLTSDSMLSRLI